MVSVKYISSKLNVTPKTVREWLKNGTLKGYQFGKSWRVKECDLEEFIKNAKNW